MKFKRGQTIIYTYRLDKENIKEAVVQDFVSKVDTRGREQSMVKINNKWQDTYEIKILAVRNKSTGEKIQSIATWFDYFADEHEGIAMVSIIFAMIIVFTVVLQLCLVVL